MPVSILSWTLSVEPRCFTACSRWFEPRKFVHNRRQRVRKKLVELVVIGAG